VPPHFCTREVVVVWVVFGGGSHGTSLMQHTREVDVVMRPGGSDVLPPEGFINPNLTVREPHRTEVSLCS
jgi:hypothetical protein